MKNKRLLIYLVLAGIVVVLYLAYVLNYFSNKKHSVEDINRAREEISFNVDNTLSELQLIKSNDNTSVSFLYDCKEKAVWLALHGYRKECYLMFTELFRIMPNTDPEIDSWYYSSMMMQALDTPKALDKLNYVYNATEGFESISIIDNFNSECIRIETYLSLPSFFSDQINSAFLSLKKLCENVNNGYSYTVTDNHFNQIKADDFSYIDTLISFASSLTDTIKENAIILSECVLLREGIQK